MANDIDFGSTYDDVLRAIARQGEGVGIKNIIPANLENPTADEYFYFTLLEDNTYSVSAKDINNLPEKLVIPTEYKGADVEEALPVTTIESNGFKGCSSIKSVTFLNTITNIKDYAFSECVNLEEIKCLTIESIGTQAFSKCSNLTSIAFGNYVDIINDQAFAYCEKLEKVVIPLSVITIGWGAFYKCNLINTIFCESQEKSFGSNDWLKKNDSSYFEVKWNYENAEHYIIEYTDNSKGAFSVKLGAQGKQGEKGEQGEQGIQGEQGKQGEQGVGILAIKPADEPLEYTSNEYFDFYEVDDGYAIAYARNATEMLNEISIPDSYNGKAVTQIFQRGFAFNNNLYKVFIPDSVKIINEEAFFQCSNLATVKLGNNVQVIGEDAFNQCTQLRDINLPQSLTIINRYAFAYCEYITKIVIPASVHTIGSSAFLNCNYLTIYFEANTLPTINLSDSWNPSNRPYVLRYDSQTSYYNIIYTNGKVDVVTAIKGENGKDGLNGKDGYPGYIELNEVFVRIWDLNAGIYLWASAGAHWLYYNGATSEDYIEVGDEEARDIFIEVCLASKVDLSGNFEIKKIYKIEAGFLNGTRKIYYGYTTETEGVVTIKSFNDIGTGGGAIDLPLTKGNDACTLQQSFIENGETKGSIANGKYSTALNQGNETYQRNSFVIGGGCEVGLTEEEFNARNPSGIDEWGSEYSKSNSFANAGGQENTAKGRGSHIGGGWKNQVNGDYSAVLAGGNNAVNGKYSSVIAGYNNQVNGNHSSASGKDNLVEADNAHAFGLGLIVNKANTTVFGRFNNENSAALIAVGTGDIKDGKIYRNNGFEVFPNGLVKSSKGSLFEGKVDFTNAEVVGLTNGAGIPTLTGQTVYLADLEAGIYRWEYSRYNEEEGYEETDKYLVLADEENPLSVTYNPVFIQVHKAGNDIHFELFDNQGMGYDETSRYICWGAMNTEDNSGYYQIKDLSCIPELPIETDLVLKKRKIELWELKENVKYCDEHIGKMVQLVYKGTNYIIRNILQNVGLITIQNESVISINGGYTEASQSDLSGLKYFVGIGSNYAYVEYYQWSFDFTATALGQTSRVNITDDLFDIYIIE